VPRSPARWLAFLATAGSLACALPAHASSPPFLGVYGEDSAGTPERAAAVADAQRAAGARVVRLPFVWSRIELLPGVLDLQEQDAALERAAAR